MIDAVQKSSTGLDQADYAKLQLDIPRPDVLKGNYLVESPEKAFLLMGKVVKYATAFFALSILTLLSCPERCSSDNDACNNCFTNRFFSIVIVLGVVAAVYKIYQQRKRATSVNDVQIHRSEDLQIEVFRHKNRDRQLAEDTVKISLTMQKVIRYAASFFTLGFLTLYACDSNEEGTCEWSRDRVCLGGTILSFLTAIYSIPRRSDGVALDKDAEILQRKLRRRKWRYNKYVDEQPVDNSSRLSVTILKILQIVSVSSMFGCMIMYVCRTNDMGRYECSQQKIDRIEYALDLTGDFVQAFEGVLKGLSDS